jgi:arabinose-5-phosphate isomerase
MSVVIESKHTPDADRQSLDVARATLRHASAGLATLAGGLDAEFPRAVAVIVRCADAGGTLLVTGLGKSGHVGAKISATFASLGIPSHAVHPTEAAHGDLGRFRPSDVVLAISKSGETDEVVNLAAILRQDGLPVIAITADALAQSSLQRLATICLGLGTSEEAGGPAFVAPTTSTTLTLALGDALALACAQRRRFSSSEFAKHHPGGSLGGLMRPVTEAMRWKAGSNLPLIPLGVRVREALELASASGRRPGALVIVDDAGRLAGIFTDGDLRRLVLSDAGALERPVREVMTRTPRTLDAGAMVRDAERLFKETRQDEFPVVDGRGKPLGILDVQDLIALRLVRE